MDSPADAFGAHKSSPHGSSHRVFAIVIGAQLRLVEHHQVIMAFAPNRSDARASTAPSLEQGPGGDQLTATRDSEVGFQDLSDGCYPLFRAGECRNAAAPNIPTGASLGTAWLTLTLAARRE
jgi:hypothetical protein